MCKSLWTLALFTMWHSQSPPALFTSPLEIVAAVRSGAVIKVALRNNGPKTITAYYFSARCTGDNPNRTTGARTDFAASTAFSEGGIKPGQTIDRMISLNCPDSSNNAITAQVQVVVFDDATWMSSDDRQLRFIAEFRKANADAYRGWVELLEDQALQARYQSGDDKGLAELLSGRPQAFAKAHSDAVPILEDYVKTLIAEGTRGWETYRSQLDACRKLREAFERSQLRLTPSEAPR